MWMYWLAIAGGLALLVWSANRFILGAAALAVNLGVPTIIIGMVIMGFGTSAPEMFVAATASLNGNPGVAVGNAIGSNIANIALVLGISALVSPILVRSGTLKRELPVLFLVSLGLLVLMLDLELSRVDGAILLVGTVQMIGWMLWLARNKRDADDPLEQEFESEMPRNISTKFAIFWSILGLILLLVSSQILVWGAVNVAKAFGISDLIIGLTIIAVGTSLPEIAVSVLGSLKGEDDMAIGNVIGSNLFNILAVLGIGAVIEPAPLTMQVLTRDYVTMLVLTIVLFVIGYGFRGQGRINRLEASMLVCAYIAYLVWLYISEVSVATAGPIAGN